MCDQPQCLLRMRRVALWMREEQWMLSALTWVRFLTGSLTVHLCPGWAIMVRKDSVMVRGWSTCPRKRG